MKFLATIICLFSIILSISSAIAVAELDVSHHSDPRDAQLIAWSARHQLTKRKGGGGGGGARGGSSGASSGTGSTGKVGGTSGSSSGSSSSGGRPGTSSSSGSSGSPRSYGGGRYYSGGSPSRYSAGAVSPRGISPLYFAAPFAFGGLLAYGAYSYPYSHPYSFRNLSHTNTTENQTIPVNCLCGQYQPCGCDDNDDREFLDSIVGNGTGLDPNIAQVVRVNGTDTLAIDGTLSNDTSSSTDTSGGNDGAVPAPTVSTFASNPAISIAFRLTAGWKELSGWWMMLATVVAIITV